VEDHRHGQYPEQLSSGVGIGLTGRQVQQPAASEPSLTDLTASAFVAARALNPVSYLSGSFGSTGGLHHEGHVLPGGDASIGSTVAAIRLSSSAGRHADLATTTSTHGHASFRSEPAAGLEASGGGFLPAGVASLVRPPPPPLRHVSSERSPTVSTRNPDWGHSSLRRSVGFASDVVDHTASNNGSVSNQQGSPVSGAGGPQTQGPLGGKPLPRMQSMLRRAVSRRGPKAFGAAVAGRVNSNDGANAHASATGASSGMAFSGRFLFCGWRKDMVGGCTVRL
jgi:hypothetical protein